MSPLKIPSVKWIYCHKNHVWTIRACKHAKCTRPTVTAESRPTGLPR